MLAVFLLLMHLEILEKFATKFAFVTRQPNFVVGELDVRCEVTFPGEFLVTAFDGARNKFPPGVVKLQMMPQRIFDQKFAAANIAVKSLPTFSGNVSEDVTSDGSLCKELKSAEIAFEVALLEMNIADVSVETDVG